MSHRVRPDLASVSTRSGVIVVEIPQTYQVWSRVSALTGHKVGPLCRCGPPCLSPLSEIVPPSLRRRWWGARSELSWALPVSPVAVAVGAQKLQPSSPRSPPRTKNTSPHRIFASNASGDSQDRYSNKNALTGPQLIVHQTLATQIVPPAPVPTESPPLVPGFL